MEEERGKEGAADAAAQDDLLRYLPFFLLGLGLVVSGVLILSLTAKLTFIADEWNLLLLRQGWGLSQFLEPFNGHPIMAPALIFKLLQEIFGMGTARPMQVAATATFLLSNVLLFVYLRKRVGEWAALIGTFLILFLGAAFEDLLFAFQIGYFGSLAAGIGALIALDRNDQKGDRIASVLLVASLLFSSIGIAFIAAVAAEWALNPRNRKQRLLVPLPAVFLYAIWWIGWGHEVSANSLDPGFEISVLPKVPGFMFDAFASGLTSLAGLATGDGSEPDQPNLVWGKIGALLLIAGAIWRIRRMGGVPKGFLVAGAGLACLLLLLALAQDAYLSYGPGEVRPPTASRYQLPIAVFIVLTAGNLLAGLRFRRVDLVVAASLAVFAIAGGLNLMIDKAKERWEPASAYTRATLLGIESAQPDYPAGYVFRPGTSFDVPINDYLNAVDDFGSPGYSKEDIPSLDSSLRYYADGALINASGITLTATTPESTSQVCTPIPANGVVDAKPGSYAIVNLGDTDLGVSLARFGESPGAQVGAVLARSRAGLELPAGSLTEPWKLTISGGPARACRAVGPK